MWKLFLRGAIAVAALGSCFALRALGSPQTFTPSQNAVGERSGWVERTLPPNFTGPTSVHALGTSIVFQTPTEVHLWSAITTHWTAVSVSPAAQVKQFNDYVTIQDGATVHGYSTRNDVVQTLQLASAPQLNNGPITSNWLSIAVLGTDAWAFSAFDGQWRHQSLAAPSPTIVISQTTAIVGDGATVYGVSTYYGDWVPVQAPPAATLVVGGDLAVAWTPSAVAGFSAHTNKWATHSFVNATPLVIERGYAMFQDGAELVAFSSCTGDFNTHTPSTSFTFIPGRYVCAATAGNDVVAYSSGRNVFEAHTFQSSPSVWIDDEVLAVQDSAGVTAFSVVTGAFSATMLGNWFPQTNDAMIWIDNGTQGYAYSAVTGGWSSPVAVGSQVQVSVMRNIVVVSDAQGYNAFSGRTGDWVAQTTATPFNFSAPSSSDLFVAFDGVRVYAFDPVIVRWATVQCSAPVQSYDIWRQTFVGVDGAVAHGFGLMKNVWSSILLHGTYQLLDANDACGFVATSTNLYTFAGHGSLTSLSRFPEFSRLQPFNSPLRLFQSAPAGSRVLAVLALHPTYTPMPPTGILFLDPASMIRRISLGIVPASGLIDFAVDLSSMPVLIGKALHVQCFVTPPSGARWLTNSIAPVIL